MGDPTQAQMICWALRELGGTARVRQIRETATIRFGPVAWLRVSSATLNLLLSRENGRLWMRVQRGTYRLTDHGKGLVDGVPGRDSPTPSMEERW